MTQNSNPEPLSLLGGSEEFERLYREGYTIKKLSLRFALSKQQVERILRNLDLSSRERPIRATPKQERLLRKLLQGQTFQELKLKGGSPTRGFAIRPFERAGL